MISKTKTHAMTIAAVAAAAAFPTAASAKFDLNPTPPAPAAPPAVIAPPAASSPSFQWDDAGIGAAGMLAVFGLAGASVVVVRQRRRQASIS